VPAAAQGGGVARANGLMETVRSLGFTAGPLVGGALGAAGLLRLALAINALSFVVVGVAALLLRARRQPDGAGDVPVRARDGFVFLLRERDLAIALGGAVAALAVFSISVTAEPFFVTEVLSGGPLATACCCPRGRSAWPPVRARSPTACRDDRWRSARSSRSCSRASASPARPCRRC